jgi:phage terminase large subunit
VSTLRPNEVKRKAEDLIARHEAAAHGRVAVLWQKSTEDAAAFMTRALMSRHRLHRSALLVVVCAKDAMPRSRGICVVELPPKKLQLFDRPARYRAGYGGRGRGDSWTFARALLVRSLERPIRILCAREFQNSIADSIHTLLSDQMEVLGLAGYFEVQATAIYGRNGSEFIFSGIRSNVTRIKSLEGVSICFVEEAASISNASWEILIPTIRTHGSEIWAAFNPDLPDDPTYQRIVTHPPDNIVAVESTYADNPWFPEPLRQEMEYLKRVDDDAYQHVWLGKCRQHSDAQIFKGKYRVDSFMPGPGWDGPYHGLDLGFAADPSVLTKCWVHENRLYVEREAWRLHCDIDRLPQLIDEVSGARGHVIRVDSSRPETVSFLKQHGVPQCESVDKWPDSVADGISRMRAFEEIVIHPSCSHTVEEFRLYSYKTDRLTGDVLPDIIDKANHCIDSIRYGIAPLIRSGGAGAFLSYINTALGKQKVVTKRDAEQVVEPAKQEGTAKKWPELSIKPGPARTKGAVVTPLGGRS